MSRLSHSEIHMVHRIGWLRAAVLGANDGLVSTASLVVGVAAAGSGRPEILIAGLAGLVAGAMSMAADEYRHALIFRYRSSGADCCPAGLAPQKRRPAAPFVEQSNRAGRQNYTLAVLRAACPCAGKGTDGVLFWRSPCPCRP